ncbi:MAG: hypothetical protein JHD35_08275 [Sphingopyxis sp.]|nr:hypothetical protein [Sphingopyxis sp.]
MFGEIHGTKEAPLLFGQQASALAAQNQRVLIAVELGAIYNRQVQKAWNGPHATFEQSLTAAGWAGGRDGTKSVAMLEMLSRLHRLKEYGARLSVVAFNGARDDAQASRLKTLSSAAGHEEAQAENIIDAANADNFDYVLVLVGNAHARKKEIDRFGDQYRPMAMLLERAGKTVSLNMAWSSGTAWNCILKAGVRPPPKKPVTTDMLNCGNQPEAGQTNRDNLPYMSLGRLPEDTDGDSFDGYFWLGTISGSPPARP